jgi:hypothetical protein
MFAFFDLSTGSIKMAIVTQDNTLCIYCHADSKFWLEQEINMTQYVDVTHFQNYLQNPIRFVVGKDILIWFTTTVLLAFRTTDRSIKWLNAFVPNVNHFQVAVTTNTVYIFTWDDDKKFSWFTWIPISNQVAQGPTRTMDQCREQFVNQSIRVSLVHETIVFSYRGIQRLDFLNLYTLTPIYHSNWLTSQ